MLSRWRNSGEVLRGSAAALFMKFAGSALGFAMFALAARSMEAAEFGSLALIFNTMSFFAVAALCGQETLIVRSWGEYINRRQPALAMQALVFGARIVLISSLSVAAIIAIGWSIWDPAVSRGLVIGASGFMFAQSLMHFSAQFSNVAAGIVIGESLREAVWRLILVLAIVAHLVLGAEFTAAEFFFTAACALIFSVLLQAWLTASRLPGRGSIEDAAVHRAAWASRSFGMWLSALLETASQYLEVVVVGLFLGPTMAAFYFVCTRITNVFAMIAGSITAYATSRISALFHTDARRELQSVLHSLSLISAALAVVAFLTILVLGKALLWAFGPAYSTAYPALLVLALGASLTALTGPAAYLLLLTGNEGIYPRIMSIGLAVRFALIAFLGSHFGLMGAAIGWTTSAIGLSLTLVVACRRLVMIDPSVMHAIWRVSGAAVDPAPVSRQSTP